MRVLEYSKGSPDIETILKRSRRELDSVRDGVRATIRDIRERGDRAITDYLRQYDGVDLEAGDFRISNERLARCVEQLPERMRRALEIRQGHVEDMARTQLRGEASVLLRPGVLAGERSVPVESVGVYVPGGTASFPTVAQILCVPAIVAGVERVVLCGPPGGLTDAVLAAAYLAGVREVYQVGGVAAIAALAYGTGTVPPVSLIVGPGNVYVTAAKMECFGVVAIDMPAGPSEAIIIADQSADARLVALDVLARAEHDALAAAVVVTSSRKLASDVIAAIDLLMPEFQRAGIMAQAVKRYCAIVIVTGDDEAVEFTNLYAPEHLEIMTADPLNILARIRNASSIFLGYDTPVAVGDYAGFTNHVLPSLGFARMFSPVSVRTFMKVVQFEMVTRDALRVIAEEVIRPLAVAEGFGAHLGSIEERVKSSSP